MIKIIKNILGTILFLAMVFVPLIAIIWLFGGAQIAAYALVVTILFSLLIYGLSDRIILRWYHATKADHLESIKINNSIQKPKLYTFQYPIPTLFTVGTLGKASIAVSSKALETFDEKEMETLLAHEMGHIKNGDVSLNTTTALFAGILTALSTFAVWITMLTGFGSESDPAPKIVRLLTMGIVAIPASLFVQAMINKDREYRADEVAADLIDPRTLASTLENMEQNTKNYTGRKINPGHAHMMPVNPLKVDDIFDVHLSLFDTHPPMDERRKKIIERSMQVNP